MKVLITGNKGYIGSVLTQKLLHEGYEVVGLDSELYKGCEYSPLDLKARQINKDVRNVTQEDLEGVDALIHLAALSNDPLGELNPDPTLDINCKASIRLASLAKRSRVKRFIFASSQGMYGIARGVVDEDSPKNPLTAYARSKLLAERGISNLADKSFTPVFLRSTTVYGVSPMLRCDILLNTMVSDAVTDGVVEVKSTHPIWRSAIHIEDLAGAYIAALKAPKELVWNEAYNAGQNENNHTVEQFAKMVKRVIPGVKIKYSQKAGPDARTYKVDFSKIATKLKKYLKPGRVLASTVGELYEDLKKKGVTRQEIDQKYIRLNRLKKLYQTGMLDANFFWKKDPRWFP